MADPRRGDDSRWAEDLGPGRGRAPTGPSGYGTGGGYAAGGEHGSSGDRRPDDYGGGYGTARDRYAAGSYRETNRRGRPTGGQSDGRDRLADPVGHLPRATASEPAHLVPRHDRRRLGALLLVGVVLIAVVLGAREFVLASIDRDDGEATLQQPPAPEDPGTTLPATTVPEVAAPASGFASPGLLTFRGSPTRSYYGEGPVPTDPDVLWTYPGDGSGMCAESTVGDEVKTWCGSGWTGQPSVFERDGRTWVVFGAYDRKIHFVDYDTGEDIIPPFETGDIIKGSVTIDPDGLPIVYSGSRDNELHVIAFDRPEPTELWTLHADDVSPTKWNDDWDGSPLVLDDYLYEGGENSQFHIVKLNRSTGDDGLVQVAPELVFNAPGWDDELTASLDVRQNDVSIENSVAYHDGVVYFANSGGLVQGWDVSGLPEGVEPTRVLRYWAGDDIDASIVIDDEGFLYVGVEKERGNARSEEVGQLIKLDPRQPDDPLV
ncbi:MAG: hypothetical protein PV358_15005, partial [Acidimicrobiales bacterium]|nr:hypothetical protein [Acidimicrobiales bacterium]